MMARAPPDTWNTFHIPLESGLGYIIALTKGTLEKERENKETSLWFSVRG